MNRILFLVIFLFLFSNFHAQNNGTPCPGTPTVTYGNKIYNTVQIGNQCWLKENLDIGTMINGVIDQTNNGIIEKYCYYDDPAECEKYGGLYTWNEAMKYAQGGNKVQGICPSGWHIPNVEELNTLAKTVNNSGNALKAIGQGQGENIGAGTNTSGFSAMLAGSRGYGGHFSHQKVYIWLWSSNDFSATNTNVLELDYSSNFINQYVNGKDAGFSVRCIKGDGLTDAAEVNIGGNISTEFSLSQNYPNPFNPSTRINFSISEPGNVVLKIFDVIGKEVKSLLNGYKSAGSYSIEFDASKLSNGVYYYQLSTDSFKETKKMILIK